MKYRSTLLEHLGMSREELPQLPKDRLDDFLTSLKRDGVRVSLVSVRGDQLKPAQDELNPEKVERLAGDAASGWPEKWKPVVVSADLRVLDGHHRVAAVLSVYPQATVPALRVDLGFDDLLKRAKDSSDLRRGVDEDAVLRSRVRRVPLTNVSVRASGNRVSQSLRPADDKVRTLADIWSRLEFLDKIVKYGSF